jgi:hypothetical protein
MYFLHPKKQVILGFKIYPKKQVILPYLENACTCKNQLVPNMGKNRGKYSHFTFLLICPRISRMIFFWMEGVARTILFLVKKSR